MSEWMRLDNAALIFPAVRTRGWSNAFRVCATLKEPVDPAILQQAVDALMPRFPSMYVSLHRGVFWHYLEKLKEAPRVRPDAACPLLHMSLDEIRSCCLRVLWYEDRIAVEFFHALTDGTGGMIYLKSLAAEYLRRKEGITIPAEHGVLDPLDPPTEAELEDSFVRTAGPLPLNRKEENSIMFSGTKERDGYLHHVMGSIPAETLVNLAHEHHCTVTSFLTAVMVRSIMKAAPRRTGNRFAKVTIPVNLRKVLGGETLRNFVLTVNVGVDPRLGTYTLDELCKSVQSQLDTLVTRQQMAARVAANVQPSEMGITKIMPLQIKTMVMRMVYSQVGEKKGSINISNLGRLELPESMRPYIKHLDFIIGPQHTYFNNCSVATYDGITRISYIRSTKERDLMRAFFTELVELGVPVTVDSNER